MNVLRTTCLVFMPLLLAACQVPAATVAPVNPMDAEPAPAGANRYVSDFEGLLKGRSVGSGFQIFLKYEGIDGDATEAEHLRWIALEGIQLRSARSITPIRGSGNREASEPTLDGLMLLKQVDRATPKLFTASLDGAMGRRAELHFVTLGGLAQTVMIMKLENCLVKNWELTNKDNGLLLESMVLDFTRIEMRYIAYDQNNRPLTPVVVGWDSATARSL